jgi:hypothetical protein
MELGSNLIVGCPISSREWIIERWRDHVDKYISVDKTFLFVSGPNDPTLDIVKSWNDAEIVLVNDPLRDDERSWTKPRYHVMVELRNTLLKRVRELQPAYFFSLDSDILLHPHGYSDAMKFFEDDKVWAVGLKAYMHPTSIVYTSAMNHTRYGWKRGTRTGSVEVIMAAKIMDPRAYSIDYEFSPMGEDIGWSEAVRRAGGVLMWDGRHASKHVMNRDMLDAIDERVSY